MQPSPASQRMSSLLWQGTSAVVSGNACLRVPRLLSFDFSRLSCNSVNQRRENGRVVDLIVARKIVEGCECSFDNALRLPRPATFYGGKKTPGVPLFAGRVGSFEE